MLSYKFRHLFSRVVASLSAVGMFSLGNSSAHADSLSGAVATYNYTANPMSFSANYVDLKCDTNGMSNLLPGEVYYNTSGVAEGCKFLCVSGFALDVTGAANTSALYWNVGEDVPVGGAETTVYAKHGCVPRPISFEVHDNFVSGFVIRKNGDESHAMGVVYPIYGSNDVRFGACAGGNFREEDCSEGDSYWDFVDNADEYFEDSALAGYTFAGLMDKNGNMVMDADFNPLVDNFDHLIEGKFGSQWNKDGNYWRLFKANPDGYPVLYAKWEPKTITVNFDCDGGTISGAVPSSVTYGSSVTMPSCIMSGKVFDGWTPSNTAQGFVSDLVVSPK